MFSCNATPLQSAHARPHARPHARLRTPPELTLGGLRRHIYKIGGLATIVKKYIYVHTSTRALSFTRLSKKFIYIHTSTRAKFYAIVIHTSGPRGHDRIGKRSDRVEKLRERAAGFQRLRPPPPSSRKPTLRTFLRPNLRVYVFCIVHVVLLYLR